MTRLDNRAVVVTGTSRGIGVGIATRLVNSGARVVGVSRTGRSGALSDSDAFVDVLCDIAGRDAPDRLLDAAVDAFGRVDALVNNAGTLHYANCWEQTDAEMDEMVDVNLTAPFRLSQRFARYWVQHDVPGVIVNVCSIESEVVCESPGQSGYAATKGGLLGLTRAMALDLARYGIRVVAVGPGMIDTEMTPSNLDGLERLIPLGGRLGTPEEIGDAVVFLLSHSARYITGQIMYVDGGYLLP